MQFLYISVIISTLIIDMIVWIRTIVHPSPSPLLNRYFRESLCHEYWLLFLTTEVWGLWISRSISFFSNNNERYRRFREPCWKLKGLDDMKGLNTRIRGKDKDTSKLVGKRGTKLTKPEADCNERVDTCKTGECPVLILHSIEITWTSLADL